MKILNVLCILSWLYPGSGHMYYRQVKKAIPFLVFINMWYTVILPCILRVHNFDIAIVSFLFYIFMCSYSAYDVYKIGSSKEHCKKWYLIQILKIMINLLSFGLSRIFFLLYSKIKYTSNVTNFNFIL
jgi:hypothetical protein